MAEKRNFKKIMQDFVKDNGSTPEIQFMLSDDIQIEEIRGQGLMNYVFQVYSKDRSQSAVIKYGEEESKVPIVGLGSTSLERQQLEFDSLELLTEIFPGSVPHPYCFDKRHHINAMENLQDMELLGTKLSLAQVDVEAAARIGKLLATIHNKTSHHVITQEKWKQLQEKFMNQDMKDLFKYFSFEEQMKEDSPLTVIPDGAVEKYRQAVDQVKAHGLQDKLLALHDTNECFIHGDCHWNHFALFPGSERIALFDFEFVCIGHPCFNLARALLGYPLYYHYLGENQGPKKTAYLENAKRAFQMIVDGYLAETEIYKDPKSQVQFVSDLALAYGCAQFAIALYGNLDLVVPITAKQKTILLEGASKMMQEHMKILTSALLVEAVFWEPVDDMKE